MRETLRVLIVEDNPADIDLIREALTGKGFVNFQIESVSRLSEALARLKNAGIELVLLDLGLPDSQGLKTFRGLMEATPHIPVIILTGDDNQEMAVLAVKEGAQDYLIKGLPWGRLLTHSALYAIERKQRESRERLVREVLDLLNRPAADMDIIRDILQLIKKGTGFEAIGIRLKEGNDFPYYTTNGFPDDFVLAESHLCAYDEEGKIVCDEQGIAVLECMCGNIIRGRTDASLPFFSTHGSFWTNSTTELSASTTEEDRQSLTRNRCHGEGYESVALIPLRTEDEIIGLLQLNDHRRNRFTLEMIHFFEGLGASIGIALTRKQAEENLKKRNEEIRDMTQQLWQAAKLATMGELSASIAHELNNPLATVSLRIESLLEKTPEDNSNHRELEIIEHEVERMGNLVANLLQFSRRGQQQLSTVDVCEEIEKTLELIYYHLHKHNIIIGREFAKDVPHINADHQQLMQLFLNLFTNASDAMPGGGTLTIRVIAPPESRQLVIEVTDTGMGIPLEIFPKVMEPFYTTKQEGKGTGLGLAICRRIVQQYNGTFDLISEGIPGRGTTARISLPVTSGNNAAGLKDKDQ